MHKKHDKLQMEMDEAVELIQTGQVENGLRLLEQVGVEGADFPDIMIALAAAYYDLGHVETAWQVLERSDPPSGGWHLEKSLLKTELLMEQEKWEEALDELLLLNEEYPEQIRVLVMLADYYAAQGLTEVACKYLEQALEVDENQPEIHIALGELYDQLGDPDRAMQQWESIGRDENSQYEVFYKKARSLAYIGEFEDAMRMFQQSLDLIETAEARFGHGFTAYRLEDWDTAIRSLSKLLEYDAEYAAAYPILAECYMLNGNEEKAVDNYRRAFDLDESNELVVLRLGELMYHRGEWEEAAFLLKRGMKWDKDNPVPYYYLGMIQLRRGMEEEAEQHLRMSFDLGGNFPDLAETLAERYLENDQPNEAAKVLLSALEGDSGNWRAMNLLAQLLLEDGQVKEACRWIEKSIMIQPGQYEMEDLLHRLRDA